MLTNFIRHFHYIKNPIALNPTGQEYASYIRDCFFDLKIKRIFGRVANITKSEAYFKIQYNDNQIIFSKNIILATGIKPKKSEITLPSNRWVSCFGAYRDIYTNRWEKYINSEVCIIGGGNSAFQLALTLSKRAKNITILVKRYSGLFPQETNDRFALRAHSQQTIELVAKTTRSDAIGPLNIPEKRANASIWLHAFSEMNCDYQSGIFQALVPLELNTHSLLASSVQAAYKENRLFHASKNVFELKLKSDNTVFISAIGVQGNLPDLLWPEIIDVDSGFAVHHKGSTSIQGLYVTGSLAGYPSVNTMGCTVLRSQFIAQSQKAEQDV